MFREYAEAGWVLCAIHPGSKGPRGVGWNLRENGVTDPLKAAALWGVGLCHAWSGTCALDIDNWELAAKFFDQHGIALQALFDDPASVHVVSGRAGRGKLLYRLPTPLASVMLAPYKAPSKKDPAKQETFHAMEFRCATAGGQTVQDVLPETVHCDLGTPYRWAYGDPVLGHWSILPDLPPALEVLWRAQLQPATVEPPAPKATRGATVDDIRIIIAGQDPDDYENWIRVGLALHHETRGSRAGLEVYDQWSRGSPKYGCPNAAGRIILPSDKWAGFGQNDATNPVTLGTLLQEKTATGEEFDLTDTKPESRGVDTRLSTGVDDILRRVVYLLDQERYYHKPLPKSDPGYRDGLDTVGDQALKGQGFDILYSRHMPMEITVAKDGSEKAKRADPRQCVRQSPHVPRVNGIGFHPGAGQIYSETDGKQYLNEFEPLIVEPLRPKPAEQEAWDFLISRIADTTFQRWLLKFYAHALAKPGVKIQAAPLLVSETPGTGKTTLMQTVPALAFGSRWVKEISPDMLGTNFNAFLAGAWFVAIEEMKTDGPRMDRAHIANKMKPWITSATIPVEFKGLNIYHIVNRVQPTASTNFRDALQLDNDDRRWGVALMHEKAMTAAEKASLFGDLLGSAHAPNPRAPGVLRWLLQQENLTGFSPNAVPPDTQGKRIMVSSGLGQWETAIAESMAYNKAPFDRDIVEPHAVQEALRNFGNVSLKRIGAFLRKQPFSVTDKHVMLGTVYCWRNQEQWQQYASSEWIKHTETGERPEGEWDLTVPLAIRRAAGDDREPDDATDLLGAL